MKKKHTTKKQTAKKYFTKNRVKANIIAISATGILVGATAITLGVCFGATSCKSSHIPSDAKVIDSNIDEKYIVQNNFVIWVSASDSNPNHNKLLDLALYASDKHINTSNFVIEGEIDFGILVNFDENVNLFGYPQSLIKLDEQNPFNSTGFGILVGNTSRPTNGKDAYYGEMDIDNSVNVSFCQNSTVQFGVYFENVINASIDIGGVFQFEKGMNPCITNTGVHFDGAMNNANVTIDGVFMIDSYNVGKGVCFNGSVTGGSIDIGGVFTIDTSYMANSSIYGILFSNVVSSVLIHIGGIFTIDLVGYAQAATPKLVSFNNTTDDEIVIDGIFTLGNASTSMIVPIGIDNRSGVSNLKIGGVFAIKSDQYISLISEINAINFTYETTSFFQGFANKTDNGTLKGIFPNATYNWNGKPIINTNTSADEGLNVVRAVAKNNSNFYVGVIDTEMRGLDNTFNQNVYNQKCMDGLRNYIKNHGHCSKNVIDWLKEIIDNIQFRK